ncbi:hypothetical protein ACJIZ3_025550 [Penstemon smallii]|uniref:Uncharacterized protein n=1 Tax=Penstemon smallii TaxID=265156 RepID=A0ABD3TUW0_9LAMI
MVKYRLNGQVYDTTSETVEEMEVDSKLLPGPKVKCMMNGKVYYPGSSSAAAEENRKIRAAPPATKIIEDCYENGRPRVKIIYVDVGYNRCKQKMAEKCIHKIEKGEMEKEITEGKPGPRLIFIKQDMDYWPGSEMDPCVMDRRAAKERAYSFYKIKPDYKEIHVPYVHEEVTEEPTEEFVENENLEVFYKRGTHVRPYYEKIIRECFATYFDPSLPGTKFIVENMDSRLCGTFRECMHVQDFFDKWNSSSLAGFLETLGYRMDILGGQDFVSAGHSQAF